MKQLNLTAEDFKKYLDNDLFGLNDVIIDFDVLINSETITWHYRHIKKATFKKQVLIPNVGNEFGLAFSNCKFEKGIMFDNVKSTNYDITINPNSISVLIFDCFAEHISFLNNCNFQRNVYIENVNEIKRIYLSKLSIDNGGLNFVKSTVDYFELSNTNCELNINNSKFNKLTRIASLNGDIGLIKSEFSDLVTIWNVECNFGLTTNYNLFKNNFKIESSRLKRLTIIGDTFEKKAEYENRDLSNNNLNTYLNKLFISETKFTEGIDFNGLGKPIEEIKLTLSPLLQGVIKFDGWKIDNLYISGVNKNLSLIFKRTGFRFFLINDFTNYSDISFDKCKGYDDSTLNLSDCDLGTTRFNEFDFDSFKEIRIDNAVIDKINPTSCEWFSDKVLKIIGETQSKKNILKRKREVYRQIKQSLKNNGNLIESLNFQARELETLKKEFELVKNKSFGNKMIMIVSETNEFGLNWIKPLKIICITTFLTYLLVLPGISNKIDYGFAQKCIDTKITFDEFISNMNVFWQLFNPVRRFDDVYGSNDSGWLYFIDLLHRIFLGIIIFQIVKAFRKFISN